MPTVIQTRPVESPARAKTVTTDPPTLTVENGEIIIHNSSFPVTPIWDDLVDELGDPTLVPVLSMRALAEVRVVLDGADVDTHVWVFDECVDPGPEDTDGV